MYTEIILSCSWKIHYLSDEILLRSLLSHNILLLGQDNWWLSALRRIISVSNKFIAADIYQKSKLVDHKSQIIKANFLMRKNNHYLFLSFCHFNRINLQNTVSWLSKSLCTGKTITFQKWYKRKNSNNSLHGYLKALRNMLGTYTPFV